ncbi:Outer membrane protein assembly factor BamB precursor [Lacunisphaera limnophila]|uniref:Outer membrane protein assembly factor BamB n=1 Tax=Lacunisphaera limnophila TaxID=1838286 RepID=A0A1D8ASA7_9BACT|nr:PQQ-binding-like beta-propeller repeat protein [Lacunisphaera limnophila]AOS43781.1 Outer membrane protein assembly factor BamB precursor [Lacunisphaera limnophila]
MLTRIPWLILALAGLTALALPAQPAPAADPILGRWTGTVGSPQGEQAEIGFEFRSDGQGGLTFRFHFPAMFLHGVEVGAPVKADGTGRYTTPFFDTRFRLEEDRLTGTFTAAELPLALTRGGDFPPRPPRAVHPPAPAALWRYRLGVGTWAPPVAADGVVYVGGGDGRFHAVRTADGIAAWVWRGRTPIDGRATLDDTSVYFLDTSFHLVALDRMTGALRWRLPLHNEFLAGGSAPANPTFNHRAATPLLHDGTLYVGSSDGGFYAVNPDTGTVRWRHEAGAPVYSGAGLVDADTLLYGTMDGSIVQLDLRTRRELLRLHTGGGVVTTPLVVADRIVAGSRDYQLHAFHRDGRPAWRFSAWFSWIESTPVLRDGLLYLGGSDFARVSAIDPVTGQSRWSTVVHGMSWGSPLVTERHVFAGTVNQNLAGTMIDHEAGLVKLDRATGAIRWRLILPKAPAGRFSGYAGGPVLVGGKVVVAGLDGFLSAYPEG